MIYDGTIENVNPASYGAIQNNGVLTIENVTMIENGANGGSFVQNMINAQCTVTNSRANAVGEGQMVNQLFRNHNGATGNSLTIKDTTIQSDSTREYDVVIRSGVANLENVTVTGVHGAIGIEGGELNLKNVKATATNYYGLYVSNSYGASTIVVDGYEYTGNNIDLYATAPDGDSSGSLQKGNVSVTVKGGTFPHSAKLGKTENSKGYTWTLAIEGGTYGEDPSAYVDPDSYRAIQNPDGTYTVENYNPFTAEWHQSYVPADTKVTRTTTGRVVLYKDGVALNTKADYTAQLSKWELVYDPEYLTISSAPSALSAYISFSLKALKSGETTIEYRKISAPDTKVTQTIKIDHYLSLSVIPTGTHLVEDGPIEISTNTTFDGVAIDFDQYTFSSADESIATVAGKVITPVKGGKAEIVATLNTDPTVSATANVTFIEAAAKVGDNYYDTITNALKVVASGDTVVLQRDVTESVSFAGQQPRVDGFVLNIDLAGHTWNAAANQSYAFRCDYGIVTIKDSVGGGAMNYGKDYVFMVSHLAGEFISKLVLTDKITYTGKTSILQDGTAGGTGANKKYYGGEVVINDGTFITVPDVDETYDDKGNFKFTLNMLDMNESAYPGGIYSPSSISVTGGTFQKFDPADCLAEGPNTNFVADGYGTVADGDNYKVVPVDNG